MGLRTTIKNKLKSFFDRLSGEHSSAAPKETIPYSRATPDENAKVVMAKLNRPKAGPSQGKDS